MFSSRFIFWALALLLLAGCKDTQDDLFPSANDERSSEAQSGSTGAEQMDLEIALYNAQGEAVTLASVIGQHKASVFYFTMWCPVCASHQSHLAGQTMPAYPEAGFYLVDYVSASSSGASRAMSEAGFASSGFSLLADLDQAAVAQFNGTMGTALVFDQAGTLYLNEDFKDGSRIEAKLAEILN